MIEDFFLDPSKLASLIDGYHPRATQVEAAKLIDISLSEYKDLVIEAPTGSGKTMSYLVPVFHQGKRTIISTKTKQLMQQLFLKDIPVMQKLFGERTVAILKGRKNYFCPHRFQRWVYPNANFYQDVIDWYSSQEEQILEIPYSYFKGSILDKISADSNQCLYAKCKYYTACPFYMAKDRANEASIVITNHHMLLTDIAVKAVDGYGTIFETADHIIFDEAHSIPDIYAMFAGTEVSLKRIVNMLLDYKEKLPFELLNKLSGMYDQLFDKVKGEKQLYDNVYEATRDFMNLSGELVMATQDSDAENEFVKWDNAYKILNGDNEGVRIAETRGKEILLKFIPMHAGDNFITGLKQAALSSVFISATLTISGTFDYFLRETCLVDENITTATLPPVFKFGRQAMLLVPELKKAKKDDMMIEIIKKVKGSILLICNSVKRMEYLYDYISNAQSEKVIFTQYDGDWSTFTSMQNIVLIGCATLREGLDLAGGDFNCVVMDKLPFEYPHDLYLSAKAKVVEEETGNAFSNFNLPRAVLYFKQAAGRLIRHESNRGIWIVFDDRILFKSYGKYFIDVLDNVSITSSVDEALVFLERD